MTGFWNRDDRIPDCHQQDDEGLPPKCDVEAVRRTENEKIALVAEHAVSQAGALLMAAKEFNEATKDDLPKERGPPPHQSCKALSARELYKLELTEPNDDVSRTRAARLTWSRLAHSTGLSDKDVDRCCDLIRDAENAAHRRAEAIRKRKAWAKKEGSGK